MMTHVGSLYMIFLLQCILFKSTILPDTSLQYINKIELDLSRSLKVKSNGVIGLPMCDFLLMLNLTYQLKLMWNLVNRN